MRNLVSNAIDHADADRPGPGVVLEVASDDDAAAVTVRDYGVGLKPGEAAMVFSRFWRADPARARTSGGTGLGLAIALEDAHLHEGWLQAWGRPGAGRLLPADAAAPARHRAARKPAAAGARRRRGADERSERMRRVAVAGVVAALLLAPTACVSMPQSGPVTDTRVAPRLEDQRATAIDPLPPRPGASAVQIAQGFLEAMTQTPISTSVNISVAREYLATDARATWNPDAETIIYDESSAPEAVGAAARVRLTGAESLDTRGAWVGDLGRPASTLELQMVLENGEYRIVDPPDALIVPASWFAQRFREVSLYYFDRTGQILVPESVFVPRGQQLASSLTEGLLEGPAGDARRVVRTFVPTGLDIGLSVPITAGVAEVSLLGEAPDRSADSSALMLAQLAATLRQDPSITSIRVTVGGQPVTLPGRPRTIPSTATRPSAPPATRPARCSSASTGTG